MIFIKTNMSIKFLLSSLLLVNVLNGQTNTNTQKNAIKEQIADIFKEQNNLIDKLLQENLLLKEEIKRVKKEDQEKQWTINWYKKKFEENNLK